MGGPWWVAVVAEYAWKESAFVALVVVAATAARAGELTATAVTLGPRAAPRVLLLDEPFSALDRHAPRRHARPAGAGAGRARAHPVLLVTHDQVEAARLATTVAVLSHGRIRQHGAPAELYQRPRSLQVHRSMGGLTEVVGPSATGCTTPRSDRGACQAHRPTARAFSRSGSSRPSSLGWVTATPAGSW